MKRLKVRLFLFLILAATMSLFAGEVNVALNKPVAVSSEDGSHPARYITDGKISRNCSWMSHASSRAPHQVTVNLKQYCDVNRIVIYSGIPEKEKRNAEKGRAPGFWSIKNMKIQYWDDANWTDLPQTEIYENRQDTILFRFVPALATFQIRLISTDGEPIRINEMEVYGIVKENMPLPDAAEEESGRYQQQSGEHVRVTVHNETIGKSMKYVAYNQGYYMPGGNTGDWLRYSNVNSLRVWTALNDYVPVESVNSDKNIASLSQFETNKKALRNNPEGDGYIRWDQIVSACESVKYSTNSMVFSYVLQETKRLGVEIVLQMNGKDFTEDWSNKWQQWQRYYALAYYAAKNGDVAMFAMVNEPNHRHAGPMKINDYIKALQIVSDAVHCAVEDVNRLHGKNLKARMVAPVTAGANTNWWVEVMKNIRTHYSGKEGDRDLIDIFSTHAYNLPALGYANKVNEIRELITDNHPQKRPLPIVFTETGRWMNAYLIDKYETMDSPSLFTEWAGEYANNTLNGCYGMWAFKMANTTSNTYPRGIKSGHHLTWQGLRIVEDAYTNVAEGKPVYDLTSGEAVEAAQICDGDKSDRSVWLSPHTNNPKHVEIDLQSKCTLGGAVVYAGSEYGIFTGPDRVKAFKLQYRQGEDWITIKETEETEAKYVQSFFIFDAPVRTDRIRFVSTDEGIIKLREIKLFDAASMKDIRPSFNISGIHRTGEVVRLFAKGFKNERPLLRVDRSSKEKEVDILLSFDETADTYYMWLVQRKIVSDSLTIDLSALNTGTNARVIAEEVSDRNYGNVVWTKPVGEEGIVSMQLPAQSVTLLTIPVRNKPGTFRELEANADASVRGGKHRRENTGKDPRLVVEMDASRADNNSVGYVRFDLDKTDLKQLRGALLKVSAHTTSSDPYRLHVYATEQGAWNENGIHWENAPLLNREEGTVETGLHTFFAGEMVAGSEKSECLIDVSDIIRRTTAKAITFIFIRELRQLGDDKDKGEQFVIQSRESADKPVLMVW